jgi:diguanylate cyclase (GGDEF)-like protein
VLSLIFWKWNNLLHGIWIAGLAIFGVNVMHEDMEKLFIKEIEQLEVSNAICINEDLDKNELLQYFKILLVFYEKNLKSMMKLTKISDSQQNYLQQIQNELKDEVLDRKKAEASLRYSNKIIQTVLDNIDALIFVVQGSTNTPLFINRYAKKEFDIDNKKSLRMCIDQVFLPDMREKNENIPITKEVKCTKSNKWYQITSAHINWIDDKKVFLQVGIDITVQKLAAEQLEYFAYTDQLTGVSNRRTGLMILEKGLKLAARQKRPISICYIDVDGLKKVNDEFGHEEGDYLICTISGIIKATLRETDTISRLGGDEFLLIFPDCQIADAEIIIGRINSRMEEHDKSSCKPYILSFSIGIEEVNGDDNLNIAELLKELDEKMYLNKLARKKQRENTTQ